MNFVKQVFSILLALTAVVAFKPLSSHAAKVVTMDLKSVVDRSSIILIGRCASYQCVSVQNALTVPPNECEEYKPKLYRLYSVEIERVIYDKHNFLKSKRIGKHLDVVSSRSDKNSICGDSKIKSKLLFLSYNEKPGYIYAVPGNLQHQNLKNIHLMKRFISGEHL